jgi:uncharacterized protein with PQ loop repeat
MTREQFVKKFYWDQVMWLMSIVNVVAMIPQPLKIISTREVAGVSSSMFVMFALIQVTFAIEFFLKKSWSAMISMGISFLLSLLTIGLLFYYR